ncbi:hypothetical protein [Metabacillus sp. FJAT-52054]|uniref:Uncharacterized protein n=1 Tax=Metabacillus sediminis TaxID=3117746 RepID=A0ABZ2NKE3_9BACI
MAFWISAIGGILVLGLWVWYYSSLGKSVYQEEKEAGKDLTYEINPFTGSAKNTSDKKNKLL